MEFTYLRPIFYLILLFITANFIYLTFIKKQIKPSDDIAIYNSIFLTIIAGVLLFQSGIIVDEFNVGGDSLTFYLMVTILTQLSVEWSKSPVIMGFVF